MNLVGEDNKRLPTDNIGNSMGIEQLSGGVKSSTNLIINQSPKWEYAGYDIDLGNHPIPLDESIIELTIPDIPGAVEWFVSETEQGPDTIGKFSILWRPNKPNKYIISPKNGEKRIYLHYKDLNGKVTTILVAIFDLNTKNFLSKTIHKIEHMYITDANKYFINFKKESGSISKTEIDILSNRNPFYVREYLLAVHLIDKIIHCGQIELTISNEDVDKLRKVDINMVMRYIYDENEDYLLEKEIGKNNIKRISDFIKRNGFFSENHLENMNTRDTLILQMEKEGKLNEEQIKKILKMPVKYSVKYIKKLLYINEATTGRITNGTLKTKEILDLYDEDRDPERKTRYLESMDYRDREIARRIAEKSITPEEVEMLMNEAPWNAVNWINNANYRDREIARRIAEKSITPEEVEMLMKKSGPYIHNILFVVRYLKAMNFRATEFNRRIAEKSITPEEVEMLMKRDYIYAQKYLNAMNTRDKLINLMKNKGTINQKRIDELLTLNPFKAEKILITENPNWFKEIDSHNSEW